MTTTPKPVDELRKGGFVMLKGHPCKIVDMTTSKMMMSSSGRKMLTIYCNACDKLIPVDKIRYACLDCPDYDLCERCEEETTHGDGKHVFAKIRNSRTVCIENYRK